MFPVKLEVDIWKKYIATVQPDESDGGGGISITVKCFLELLKR